MLALRLIWFAISLLLLSGYTLSAEQAKVASTNREQGSTKQILQAIDGLKGEVAAGEAEKLAVDKQLSEYTRQLAVYTKQLSDYTHDVSIFTAWLVGATVLLAIIGAIQWYEARKTAKRQLRAYVSIVAAYSERTYDEHAPKFVVEIKNCGQTPAYDLTGWAAIEVRAFPFVGALSATGSHPVDTKMSLAPGGEYKLEVVRQPEWTEEEILSVSGARAAIYWFGQFTYLDAFNEKRTTDFCYLLRRKKPGEQLEMKRHTHGNGAT